MIRFCRDFSEVRVLSFDIVVAHVGNYNRSDLRIYGSFFSGGMLPCNIDSAYSSAISMGLSLANANDDHGELSN